MTGNIISGYGRGGKTRKSGNYTLIFEVIVSTKYAVTKLTISEIYQRRLSEKKSSREWANQYESQITVGQRNGAKYLSAAQ